MTQNESRRENDPEIDDLAFEEALAQLEKIVRSLDVGQSNLETSLADYERGVKLLRHCHAALQNAERRIEILKNVSANGLLETEIVDKSRFQTDVSRPGQRRGESPQDSGIEETSQPEKSVRKKRVRKTSQNNDFDNTKDVPFDFD